MFAAMAPAPTNWDWALPAGIAPPPVPADNPMSAAKVALGRRLFHDADLSIDGTMSCATCHSQRHGFADDNRTRPGVDGSPGRRNVPGLVNIAWATPLTWADPRLTTLEAQMLVPVLGDHPVEMGMKGKEAEIARRLSADACYGKMFTAVFPESGGRIDMANIARAMAAFERTMISFDTPFDKAGRGGAPLSAQAQRGAKVFFGEAGCAACHSGLNFTDYRFHRLTASIDPGLNEVSGRTDDLNRFRTPGLRNVALTAPYLHDGSAATLADALRAHGVKAVKIGHVTDIIAFLETLTDASFVADRRYAYPEAACPS